MLLDVSHLGAAGVEHVLEISRRPVIATHSNARALCDHHRNLTDEQLRAIAAAGGVVCVNVVASFVHPTEHTVERLLDQFCHVIAVAGTDHVGLGPDFMLELDDELTPPWARHGRDNEGVDMDAYLPGLTHPSGLPLITKGLLDRGLDRSDVAKIMGGNVLRLSTPNSAGRARSASAGRRGAAVGEQQTNSVGSRRNPSVDHRRRLER